MASFHLALPSSTCRPQFPIFSFRYLPSSTCTPQPSIFRSRFRPVRCGTERQELFNRIAPVYDNVSRLSLSNPIFITFGSDFTYFCLFWLLISVKRSVQFGSAPDMEAQCRRLDGVYNPILLSFWLSVFVFVLFYFTVSQVLI